MGLAASQARFLALTARKAHCEFNSLQLAQQKMSISRELSNASSEYENSLNATKLVWDASGIGDNTLGYTATQENLSYKLLMKPSLLNAYNPYLLTDPKGKVILTREYLAAAKAISPNGTPVSPSESGYAEFVKKLQSAGIINEFQYSNMQKDLEGNMRTGTDTENLMANYLSKSGLGGPLYDKTANLGVTIAGLIEVLDDSDTYNISYNSSNFSTFEGSTKKNTIEDAGSAEWTLGYILKKKIGIATADDNEADKTRIIDGTKDFIVEMAKLLGYDPEEGYTIGVGLCSDDTSGVALQNAYNITLNRYSTIGSSVKNKNSNDYNVIYKDTGNERYEVSLTNVLKSFLTDFASALANYQGGWEVANTKKNSTYVTDDHTYTFLVDNKASILDSKSALYNDYYSMLYNQICTKGWVDDEVYDVSNSEYLENELKNGQIFISSLNADDGKFYQTSYSDTEYVVAVKDTDAIARAEAKYNALKTKLDSKEEGLDLQMKQLDLEISAINTEFESVKGLITKNIDKTFNMFGGS